MNNLLYVVRDGFGNMIMTTPTIRAFHMLGYKVTVAIRETVDNGKNSKHDYEEGKYIFYNDLVANVIPYTPNLLNDFDTICESVLTKLETDKTIKPDGLPRLKYHEAYVNLTVAQKLGYDCNDIPSPFFADLQWQGADSDTIFVGNPTGKRDFWNIRAYPYIYELMDLLKEQGYNPVQIGSAKDAEHWDKEYPYVIPKNLYECGRALSAGLYYIGQDCGITHIAAALNMPTFAIFGPTSSVKNYPQGDRSSIFTSTLDCSPCQGTKKFKEGFKGCHAPCMKELTPDVLVGMLAH